MHQAGKEDDLRRSWWWLETGSGSYREYQAYSLGRQERGGSRRLRRGGDASSSAAQPDVGTSLSGLSFIKILFRACRERRERERTAEPLAREPSPPFSRHYQRTLATPSSRASHALFALAEGLLRRADIRVVIYFFSVHSPTYVSRRFRSSTCPSVRSFVRSFLRGQSKSKTKKGGSVKETEETHVVTKEGETFAEICAKMANGIGCL